MSIKRPARSRLRRSPEASRDNILAAAEALLVEKGPQSLKLADVAAAAGVANATVLHHFGSIDDVQAALMDRMIRQLADKILSEASGGDPASSREAALQSLFDAFETRGAARLAAWIELTDEANRLTSVRQAVRDVAARRMTGLGLTRAKAENLVLISVVLAMGVGLFGHSLAALIGKPADRARKLAIDLLQGRLAELQDAGGKRTRP